MSGLLGLLVLGGIFGSGFIQDSRMAAQGIGSKEFARKNGDDTYYDGFKNLHWTATGEVINKINLNGVIEYRGVDTDTIYKIEKMPWRIEIEEREQALQEAIAYCKENGIKYLNWYFPTNVSRTSPASTGIEIETGKKYVCNKYIMKYENGVHEQLYSVIYLEDEPHEYCNEYGHFKEYVAVHDSDEISWKKDMKNNSMEQYRGVDELRLPYRYFYYTKKTIISEKEGKERLHKLDKFPFKPYKIRA